MNFVRCHNLLSSSISSPTPTATARRKLSQSGAVLFVLLTIVFAAAVPARADSLCATGTVTSILSTSCTIGDKTFVFGPNAWTGNMLSNNVIFTPDASNPNSPGFTLSAVFSLTGGSTLVLSTEELDYGVAITNPASGAVIIGTTGTETGAFVSWANANPTTTLDALAYSNITNGSSCSDSSQVGIFGLNGSVAFNTPSDTEDHFPSNGCTSTTAAIGMAQIFLAAQDGTVSLSTAGYYVDETAPSTVVPTPEPEALLLVGSGMLGLATLHHRRRHGASPAQEETA
jgi:hypothetical protein